MNFNVGDFVWIFFLVFNVQINFREHLELALETLIKEEIKLITARLSFVFGVNTFFLFRVESRLDLNYDTRVVLSRCDTLTHNKAILVNGIGCIVSEMDIQKSSIRIFLQIYATETYEI